MRPTLALTAAALLFFVAGTAQAEDGRVSQASLQAMGLSGLQTMSDEEGQAVRGKFAIVFGHVKAQVLFSSSKAAFFGIGRKFAAGEADASVSVGPLGASASSGAWAIGF